MLFKHTPKPNSIDFKGEKDVPGTERGQAVACPLLQHKRGEATAVASPLPYAISHEP